MSDATDASSPPLVAGGAFLGDDGGGGPDGLIIGLDVGSTTVKAVVMEPGSREILWADYQFHETRQPDKVLELLKAIEQRFPLPPNRFRIFATGSGGATIASHIGARFVQEVNAIALAAEALQPDVGSVIELGGQDAKIIIWLLDPKTGRKRKLATMNDKCAGGTGAVIDRIAAKLHLSQDQLRELRYTNVKLHPVAGKCGVFAETDINSLQKQGIPPQELMVSLLEAIVQQNLSVLTRGNTLRPKVLLLGGPNTFLPCLEEAWRQHIPGIWQERGLSLPEGATPHELIVVPENSLFYAALGAALYGQEEEGQAATYEGTTALEEYIEMGRRRAREATGQSGFFAHQEELAEFRRLYETKPFTPSTFSAGQVVEAYMGVDGGSTSTKAVLTDGEGHLLAKAYQLCKGNPLQDAKEVLGQLRQQVEGQGARLRIRGVGTTGYAKDLLKEALGGDVAIPETVAHAQSALRYYPDVDVIADVGGQDIKVIIMKRGKVKDFKLNTQCSAGNGYFLQSTAARFGYDITQYAEMALGAQRAPTFHYGCAVFLEQDISHFQQLGWQPSEIMAGLAVVLPKNVWLYVVQETNLARFGHTFLLQGGTHYNLAVVKAQRDFISARVPQAQIYVHPHAGESGALGAALEAIRVMDGRESSFIGFDQVEGFTFTATRDESTRCVFCKNKCLRTFVDIQTSPGHGTRFIAATCERGMVGSIEEVRAFNAREAVVKKANPNFVEIATREAFRSYCPPQVASASDGARLSPWRLVASRKAARMRQQREGLRIGIPRVLSMYSYAPFYSAYLESLGVKPQHIVWSDYSDDQMYREGSHRGSIDPCFPAKVSVSHVHNLLYKKRVDVIFFPVIMSVPTEVYNCQASWACPTVQGIPEVAKAAFTTERDAFAERSVPYYDPVLHMAEPHLFERQMYLFFHKLLGVTREENRMAMEQGYLAMKTFLGGLRRRAREVLDRLEEEGRVGVVLLGRPYHNDPGVHHDIPAQIQKLGYPVFTIDSLPTDFDILDRLFGEEIRRGEIADPLDSHDAWKHSFSENTSRKVWAAKYVARHPSLVGIDISSFKCGLDSPIYHVVEGALEASDTPYFTFHDLDENRPAGSIKLRVETIAYFLRRHHEEVCRRRELAEEVERRVVAYREQLQRELVPTKG
ncbi:MAG: acyl-CoA dehydratase activase-related protein [Dehalococcoidia bacterium]|nr:acyl-CoA dehydratase activase-related protein [Dehalococcoidia bacterium]